MIGTLRGGGFSVEMTAHAFALIDSYVFGFALRRPRCRSTARPRRRWSRPFLEHMADGYPHLVEFTTEHAMQPGYDFGDEFGFGLDLILDGLESRLRAAG